MKETFSTRSQIAKRYNLHPVTVTRKVNEAAATGLQMTTGTGRGLRINDRLFDRYMKGKK